MMSSLANTALFLALITTSVIVAVMYFKLKRLDAYHAEYKRIFDKTGEALLAAQAAVSSFGAEGKDTLSALGHRIDEAKTLVKQLEALTERSALREPTSSNASHS